MKKLTILLTCLLLISFAFNEGGRGYICPECLEAGCIYNEIEAIPTDGTDSGIYSAVLTVCGRRGITDPATINNILSNYYL